MKTLEKLLKEGTEILRTAGIEEAGLDAWLLLEYASGKNKAYFYAHADEAVSKEQEETYLAMVRERAEHIPLQHITHRACFMGYDFFVNEHVLVPRQDTEVLVEEALNLLKKTEKPQILDMCTGSGCILFSILLEKEKSCGTGVDVSEKALEVAKKNRDALKLTQRALLLESDLFSSSFFQEKDGKEPVEYDMLISNPPYIPTSEIEGLMEEVRFHDPRLALDGHEDGLYFYRRITSEGKVFLKPGGWLLYEIGYDQGEDVARLMRDAGFSQVQVKKDLAGLDRVVLGQKQEENHV